jgi:hypothetical protein
MCFKATASGTGKSVSTASCNVIAVKLVLCDASQRDSVPQANTNIYVQNHFTTELFQNNCSFYLLALHLKLRHHV